MTHTAEVQSGERFAFGENWARFLEKLDPARIAQAELAIKAFLRVENLEGKSFLDLGSGSGLSSLAARRLGARVCSVDYDPTSVSCTRRLREQFFPGDSKWEVLEGSALDPDLNAKVGRFDVVYSWGVLHHTGAMWDAIRNTIQCVGDAGLLFLSIYNDQGRSSRIWLNVKRAYNRLPGGLRFLVLAPSFARLWGPTTVRDLVQGKPFKTWRSYKSVRGMSPWEDVIDWVGGYPFEVAKPEEIFEFVRRFGFDLENMKTCGGGHGCNEFLFRKRRIAVDP